MTPDQKDFDKTYKWPWLQTFSGLAFIPSDPKPEMIDIVDIAVALSRESRFNGHTRSFWAYNVAQHSVFVSNIVPWEHRLWGLLHDASEAYLKDLTWSVKQEIRGAYKPMEEKTERVIAEKFGLPWPMPACIKDADNIALATEKRDLMANSCPDGYRWQELPDALPGIIQPLSPLSSLESFMRRYNEITGKRVQCPTPTLLL